MSQKPIDGVSENSSTSYPAADRQTSTTGIEKSSAAKGAFYEAYYDCLERSSPPNCKATKPTPQPPADNQDAGAFPQYIHAFNGSISATPMPNDSDTTGYETSQDRNAPRPYVSSYPARGGRLVSRMHKDHIIERQDFFNSSDGGHDDSLEEHKSDGLETTRRKKSTGLAQQASGTQAHSLFQWPIDSRDGGAAKFTLQSRKNPEAVGDASALASERRRAEPRERFGHLGHDDDDPGGHEQRFPGVGYQVK
ncbi:hypothetical protein CC1G_13581 [Coprinopsis cinerea okayama7|uniref:Uncharacterized protein n=1 Tax=Coprinopsis cinerea (strain Okayama-7 / 130 / ATCC MYA-4618 / FGSC 9003) TaxID=240176 RepID=D6RJS3_COPC7|nr:hypothetical protein CC1G_13581 [Coprinopsis cinerea okayama7\|eukprot:XP_002912053.1 hypothetical protein CC1G_13581 [Coprinopsis cinerea okayama7\